MERRSSGVLSILPDGRWGAVHAVTVGEFTEVRVMLYRPLANPAGFSQEAAAALAGRGLAIDAARTAAGGPIGVDQVVDAVRSVDVAAVEGWLIEHGQGFEMDAERLVLLDEAEVPA